MEEETTYKNKYIRREIITEARLIDELKHTAEKVLKPWIVENELNFATVILVSMSIIEEYTKSTVGLSSSEKLQKAIELLPIIVDYGVKYNKITSEKGDELKNYISISTSVVKQVIEAYIIVSKCPQVIQFKEDVQEYFEKHGCCKKSNLKPKSKSIFC